MPEVWVKEVDSDDISEFTVSLQIDAHIDHLKKAIRTELELDGPLTRIQNIYKEDEPINAINPKEKVFDEDGKPRWKLLCYSTYVNVTGDECSVPILYKFGDGLKMKILCLLVGKRRAEFNEREDTKKSKLSFIPRNGHASKPFVAARPVVGSAPVNVKAALINFLGELSTQAQTDYHMGLTESVTSDAKEFVEWFEDGGVPEVSVLPKEFKQSEEFVFPSESSSELAMQKSDMMQYFVRDLDGKDTSLSSGERPVFMAPRTNDDNQLEQSLTAKPDMTHRWLPLFVELKAHDRDFLEVTKQTIDRLYAEICANSLIKHSCGIVVTPTRAMLLKMEQGIAPQPLRLFAAPFPLREVYSVWSWLSEKEDDWWFHDHYNVMMASLGYLFGEATTAGCGDKYRISLLGMSSSSVYEIRVPPRKQRSETQSSEVLHEECYCFTIKINENETRFSRVMAIVEKLSSTPERIVFAGGWVYEDEKNKSLSVVGRVFGSHKLSQHTACNSHCTDIRMLSPGKFVCGFTAMLKGIQVNSLNQINSEWPDDIDERMLGMLLTREKVVGIYASLKNLHSVGVCHCDIRPSNVLYFPQSTFKRYALIDYDFCVEEGSEVSVDMYSGQFDIAAMVLDELGDAARWRNYGSVVVKWTREHDLKMVTAYALHKIGVTFTTIPMAVRKLRNVARPTGRFPFTYDVVKRSVSNTDN